MLATGNRPPALFLAILVAELPKLVSAVTTYTFLTDEWIRAAEAIHAEYADRIEAPDEEIRINITVIDAPFSNDALVGHVDSASGNTIPQWGPIDDPQATITVPYEVARSMFVSLDFEQVVMAFMGGQIEVEGDITRLLFLQDLDPTPEQAAVGEEIATRLQAITA